MHGPKSTSTLAGRVLQHNRIGTKAEQRGWKAPELRAAGRCATKQCATLAAALLLYSICEPICEPEPEACGLPTWRGSSTTSGRVQLRKGQGQVGRGMWVLDNWVLALCAL